MAHASDSTTRGGHRSLIELEAFNDAAAAVSARTKDWHFTAAFYFLTLIAGASFVIPFQLLKGNAGIWWQLLIAPSCVMSFGAPLLLRVMRHKDTITESEPLLNCPQCDEQLAHAAVRTCGRCLECGMQVVALPEYESVNELRDRDQVVSERARSGRLMIRWVITPFVIVFGGGCVVAAIQQSFVPLEFATVASVVAFFGGLGVAAFLDRGSEPIKCPSCDWNGANTPHRVPWMMATCRCPNCGQVALSSNADAVADTLLDRSKLREMIKRRQKRYIRGAITACVAVLGMLIGTVVARANGVHRDTAASWAFAIALPIMLWALWHGAFSQLVNTVDRCQLCEGDIDSALSVVATTGKCPACAGLICDVRF